jgi:hypothetical protein
MNMPTTNRGIIYRPVFYFKGCVSETGFYFRLQVERAQMGPHAVCLFLLDSADKVPPEDGEKIQSPTAFFIVTAVKTSNPT